MSIVRSPRRQRFTTVDNRAIEDAGLSFRARGVLVYILSKPDNWRTNREHLASQGTEGVDAIRSALSELEQAGYIERVRRQGQGGRFEWEAVVHEVPARTIGGLATDGPATDGSATGGESTALVSTESVITERTKTETDAPLRLAAGELDLGLAAAPASSKPLTDRIVRDVQRARSPQPVEKLSPRLVGRLLSVGWTEAEVRAALMTSAAWSPGSIQVELQKQTGRAQGRTNGSHVTDSGPPREAWDVDGTFFGQEVRP